MQSALLAPRGKWQVIPRTENYIVAVCTCATACSIAVSKIITPGLSIISVNLSPLKDRDIGLLSTLLRMFGTLSLADFKRGLSKSKLLILSTYMYFYPCILAHIF